MRNIHIISHTHWDREWYRPFQLFRLKLVHLVDGLLDILDRDPDCKRLVWRHGISQNILDKKRRVSEITNWIEYQVLPTRGKRGRG